MIKSIKKIIYSWENIQISRRKKNYTIKDGRVYKTRALNFLELTKRKLKIYRYMLLKKYF